MDLACICGAKFRSMIAEARHRHNFPIYCRPAKRRGRKVKAPDGLPARRRSRAKARA